MSPRKRERAREEEGEQAPGIVLPTTVLHIKPCRLGLEGGGGRENSKIKKQASKNVDNKNGKNCDNSSNKLLLPLFSSFKYKKLAQVRVAPDCNRSYCEDSFSGYSGSV